MGLLVLQQRQYHLQRHHADLEAMQRVGIGCVLIMDVIGVHAPMQLRLRFWCSLCPRARGLWCDHTPRSDPEMM